MARATARTAAQARPGRHRGVRPRALIRNFMREVGARVRGPLPGPPRLSQCRCRPGRAGPGPCGPGPLGGPSSGPRPCRSSVRTGTDPRHGRAPPQLREITGSAPAHGRAGRRAARAGHASRLPLAIMGVVTWSRIAHDQASRAAALPVRAFGQRWAAAPRVAEPGGPGRIRSRDPLVRTQRDGARHGAQATRARQGRGPVGPARGRAPPWQVRQCRALAIKQVRAPRGLRAFGATKLRTLNLQRLLGRPGCGKTDWVRCRLDATGVDGGTCRVACGSDLQHARLAPQQESSTRKGALRPSVLKMQANSIVTCKVLQRRIG